MNFTICSQNNMASPLLMIRLRDYFQSIYHEGMTFEIQGKGWAINAKNKLFSFLSTAIPHWLEFCAQFLPSVCIAVSVTSRCQALKKTSSSYNLLNVCHREYFIINNHLSNPLLPALLVFKLWICLAVVQYVLHSASNSSSTTTPSITTEHFCRAQINY